MVSFEQAQAQQNEQLSANAKAYASFNAALSGNFGSYSNMNAEGKAAYDKGLSDSGFMKVGDLLVKKGTLVKNPFDTSNQNYKTGSKGEPQPSPKSLTTFEKDPAHQFTKRRGEPFSSKGYTNVNLFQPKQGVIELANRTPNYYGGKSGKDQINNRLLEEQQINRNANLKQQERFAAITNARSAYDLFEPNTRKYKKPYQDNIKVVKPTFTEREGIEKAAARVEKEGLPPIMVGKLVGSRANTISFADVEEYKQPKIYAEGRKPLSQETATKIEARRAAAKEVQQEKQVFGQPTISYTEQLGTKSSSIDIYGNIATTEKFGTKASSYKPALQSKSITIPKGKLSESQIKLISGEANLKALGIKQPAKSKEPYVIGIGYSPLDPTKTQESEQARRGATRALYNVEAGFANIPSDIENIITGKRSYYVEPSKSATTIRAEADFNRIFLLKPKSETDEMYKQADVLAKMYPVETTAEAGTGGFLGGFFTFAGGGKVKEGVSGLGLGKRFVEGSVKRELKRPDFEKQRKMALGNEGVDIPRTIDDKSFKKFDELQTKIDKKAAEDLMTVRQKSPNIPKGVTPPEEAGLGANIGKATGKGTKPETGFTTTGKIGSQQILEKPTKKRAIDKLFQREAGTNYEQIIGTASGAGIGTGLGLISLTKQEQEQKKKEKKALENLYKPSTDLGQKSDYGLGQGSKQKSSTTLIQQKKEKIEPKSGLLYFPRYDTAIKPKYGTKTAMDFPPFSPTRTATTPDYGFAQLPKLQEKQLTRQKPIFEPIPIGRFKFGDGGSIGSDWNQDWNKFYRVYDIAKQPFGKVKVGLGYFQDQPFEFFDIVGKGKGSRVSKFYDYY